jgi:hypothetical protein
VNVPTDLKPGTEFGGCTILELIGSGGMGVVYLARDPKLERDVALKVIRPEHARTDDFQHRFRREAKLAAKLYHPNIVQIHRLDEWEGEPFVVLQWIQGHDLGSLLAQETRLEPARAVALAGQIASALDAAHDIGLVHRDVKPANVLISQEQTHEHAFVADFGIAIDLRDDDDQHDQVPGSMPYIAPERLSRKAGDRRSDIYSLGCVLFEMLTGDVPFPKTTPIEMGVAHLNDPVPTASGRSANCPEALDTVLTQALAKHPGERFPTAGALARAAQAAIEPAPDTGSFPIVAGPAAAPDRTEHIVQPGGELTTIEEAVARARPGERIVVRPGFYRESLRIATTDLEIVGDGPRADIVVSTTGRTPVLTLAATGVSIANLTVKHRPGLIPRTGHAVVIESGTSLIRDCEIDTEGRCCVLARGPATARLRNNRIRGGVRAVDIRGGLMILQENEIFGSGYNMPVLHGDGVCVGPHAEARILRNRVHDIEGEGIVFSGRGVVRHNDVSKASHAGLQVSRVSTHISVKSNRIHHCAGDGVVVESSGNGTYQDNDIFANAGAGMRVRQHAAPIVRGNRFFANAAAAIHLDQGAAGSYPGNDEREDVTLSDTPVPEAAVKPTGRFHRILPARHDD